MSIVAVVGPTSSTTALALASAWPGRGAGGDADDVVLVEADPAGGVLAGWLDVPLSPGLASAVAAGASSTVDQHAQTARGALRVVVAPVRSIEASRAVHEARRHLLPQLAAPGLVAIVDGGALHTVDDALLAGAELVVLCARQRAASATAVAADLDRVAELGDTVAARGTPMVLAVVGSRPFPAAEVAAYVGGDGDALPWCELAEDPWAAAVLAGRVGSERRFRRSALATSAARAATLVAGRLEAVGAAR